VRNRRLVNLAASVHQRLLNQARESQQSFNSLLQRFAMERFLYRLSRSGYADRFVLKGALMFAVWQLPQSRSTLDIDLLGRGGNDVEELVGITRMICEQAVEPDGMSLRRPITRGCGCGFEGRWGRRWYPCRLMWASAT